MRLLACAVLGWMSSGGARVAAQTAVDGALSGRVLLSCGQKAALVTVRVQGAGMLERRQVALQPDGSFVLLRLEPGTYTVEARVGDRMLDANTADVGLGETSDVTLRVRGEEACPGRGQAGAGRSGFGRESRTGLGDGLLSRDSIDEPEAIRSARRRFVGGPAASDAVDSNTPSADGAVETDERTVDSTREDTTDERAERRQSGTNVSAAGVLSFRGLAPTQNASLLDGVSGDQEYRGGARGEAPGGPRSSGSFATGSVRAFHVAPRNYGAQYGGAASGLLTTASRSGGTAVHGGGSVTLRSGAFNASNPFSLTTHYHDGIVTNALVKPKDRLQYFAARVGGPLPVRAWHGRVVGFASIDAQRRNFPAIASPTLPGGTGISFYALTPTQSALLGTRGVGMAATRAALNYLDSLTGEVARRADRSKIYARLDWQIGSKDRVSLGYARGRLSSPAGTGNGASTGVLARGAASVGDETVDTDAVTGRWLRLLTPRVTQELRVQYARDLEMERPRTPLAQEPAISPGGYAPEVSIAGGEFLYGTPAALGRNAFPDERRMQVVDMVQWAVKHHVLSAGFDWSRVTERIDALNNVEGTFSYDSGTTGGHAGGLVDWITDYTYNVRVNPNGGCPAIYAAVHYACFRSYTQSFGQQQVAFTMNHFAGFVQDAWRVRPGLTVEAGARYEYTLLPLPQRPNSVLDGAFAGIGATSSFPEDRNNLGPRIAVAWSPGWLTARLGYGAYFGRLPGSTVRAALVDTALPAGAQGATVSRIRITPQTVTACPQVANQGFGFACAYGSAPPAAVATTSSAVLFAKEFRLPVVQQAQLTLERGLGRHAVLRATYAMAVATQLPNSTDVNVAAATATRAFVLQGGDGRAGVQDGETFVVPGYSARRASQFGAVTEIESNANATWHGLTVEGRMRGVAGLEAHASYTWSKALDYGAEQGTTPRVNGQFDPFEVRYDKGRADADFPHRLQGSLAWETRLPHGSRLLRGVVGGWKLAAIGSAGSGRPYSYEIFGGTRLSGGAESINGAGGSAYLPTVGRNTLRLPLRWTADARLARGFKLTDKLRAEGFLEALNVANHVNATRVNARAFLVGAAVGGVVPLVFQSASAIALEGLNTPAFGTVTSSSAGSLHERALQAGVRISF